MINNIIILITITTCININLSAAESKSALPAQDPAKKAPLFLQRFKDVTIKSGSRYHYNPDNNRVTALPKLFIAEATMVVVEYDEKDNPIDSVRKIVDQHGCSASFSLFKKYKDASTKHCMLYLEGPTDAQLSNVTDQLQHIKKLQPIFTPNREAVVKRLGPVAQGVLA